MNGHKCIAAFMQSGWAGGSKYVPDAKFAGVPRKATQYSIAVWQSEHVRSAASLAATGPLTVVKSVYSPSGDEWRLTGGIGRRRRGSIGRAASAGGIRGPDL